MKKDDLTRLKYIEVSRMKLLNSHGISTIKQLYEMPEEKLAGIKTIGAFNAKLIKKSAAEHVGQLEEKAPARIMSDKERKREELNANLAKKMHKLLNLLNRVDEKLRPLGKSKFVELYIDFKKNSTDLKSSIDGVVQKRESLPKKAKKKIIKRADNLHLNLKKTGKKPKKKTYKKITEEIQAFSRMLEESLR